MPGPATMRSHTSIPVARQRLIHALGWLLAVWWALTLPPEAPAHTDQATRELARRARLCSIVLLCFIGFEIAMLPICLVLPEVAISEAIALVADIAMFVLNRRGQVTAVGFVLVTLYDCAIAIAIIWVPSGRLDGIYLPALDLYAVAVLIAAAMLPAVYVVIVIIANSLLMIAHLLFQPRTSALDHAMATQAYLLISRPIALQLVIAGVAICWTQSMLRASRRADLAEEIAELREADAVLRQELEEGVRELLAVHIALANGNFSARVAPVRNHLLWTVGLSLNTLSARLHRVAGADHVLRREHEAALRLAEAIYAIHAGEPASWPAPTGGPLDIVLAALRATSASRTAPPNGDGSGWGSDALASGGAASREDATGMTAGEHHTVVDWSRAGASGLG